MLQKTKGIAGVGLFVRAVPDKGEKPPQRVCRNYCTGRNASAAKAVPGICAHMEKAYGTGRMSIPKRYG